MNDLINRKDVIQTILNLTPKETIFNCTDEYNDTIGDMQELCLDIIEEVCNLPSIQLSQETTNIIADDLISRQEAIHTLMNEPPQMNYDFYYAAKIKELPSAQPKLPPYVVEIEAEYQKAVNQPHIHKPLAKALYEVWKKHDREDVRRNE